MIITYCAIGHFIEACSILKPQRDRKDSILYQLPRPSVVVFTPHVPAVFLSKWHNFGDTELSFVMQHAKPGSSRYLTYATNPLLSNCIGK